ncbi:hypothetical protein [Nocardioides sp. L-11A]|uniref:hypothetical protein n=1 Tax=Nocardioides sp. L-11A TaxID=3043848 RepID=UPI00249B4135|nr:hypothetical protein QJ852_05430 [Nocardioides sp. L-11A]
MEQRPRHREDSTPDGQDGQVSEVGNLDDAGTAESPADAVAGHPIDDDVQEGAAGPNARTGDQDREEDR